MTKVNRGKEPTAADFKEIAIPYLKAIHSYYEIKGSFHVSDVLLDVEENGEARQLQFVNLVQEGGGVLGVALVGYTYVLEELGIRFLKLAGTSAGAINTLLMAAINRKQDKKSEIILDILANKNLFDFVDGHWLARTLIKMFVRSKDSSKKMFRWIIAVIMLLVGLYLLNFYLLGRNPYHGFTQAVMMITSMFFLLVVGVGFWIRHLFKRFDRNGYGINPGKDFTDWISSILQDPDYGPVIYSLKDLKNHLLEVPNIYHRDGKDVSDLKVPKDGDEFITLISSDITSQMKVEFPKMWKLYWDDASQVNPADFVRASMSIPVFFEVFRIKDIPIDKVSGEWEKTLNMTPPASPPTRAMLVDGGIISNFPINIFFNANVDKPRLPSFGVMLEDVIFKPKERFNSLGDFIYSIFNTVRFHYDKDFLIKHNDFEKTIGRIDVRKFNWLNFNIEGKEKLRLFKKGVEAATEFLIGTNEVLKIPGNEIDPKFARRDALN